MFLSATATEPPSSSTVCAQHRRASELTELFAKVEVLVAMGRVSMVTSVSGLHCKFLPFVTIN